MPRGLLGLSQPVTPELPGPGPGRSIRRRGIALLQRNQVTFFPRRRQPPCGELLGTEHLQVRAHLCGVTRSRAESLPRQLPGSICGLCRLEWFACCLLL